MPGSLWKRSQQSTMMFAVYVLSMAAIMCALTDSYCVHTFVQETRQQVVHRVCKWRSCCVTPDWFRSVASVHLSGDLFSEAVCYLSLLQALG